VYQGPVKVARIAPLARRLKPEAFDVQASLFTAIFTNEPSRLRYKNYCRRRLLKNKCNRAIFLLIKQAGRKFQKRRND
jgi:hypothetical protein